MPVFSSILSPAGLRVANCQLHGVLVHVFGVGVLVIGESGVGKTAGAIELLRRGHAIVADDAVQIFNRGADLFGRAPEITRSLVHVRGVGIAKVTDVFRSATLLSECRIDICFEIYRSNRESSTPELGFPFFRIATGPPTSIADRIESIARRHADKQVQ